MWSWFHGWKRKTGIVALAIACTLTWWWLRSLWIADRIQIVFTPDIAYEFFSEDGAYIFVRVAPVDEGDVLYTRWWSSGPEYETRTTNAGETTVTKRKEFNIVNPDTPYWPLAMAWTAISAWCLFSKSGKRVSDPAPK